MKCPGCSNEVSGKFCKYCGYDLTAVEEPTVIRLGEESQADVPVSCEKEIEEESEGITIWSVLGKVKSVLVGITSIFCLICFITPFGDELIEMVVNIPACIEAGCMIWEFDDKQDEIIQYYNTDMDEILEIRDEFIDAYNAVIDSEAPAAERYEELTEKVLELADKHDNAVIELAGDIEDEEILEVHKIYMKYSDRMRNATVYHMIAIENDNVDSVLEANAQVDRADEYFLEYKMEMRKLSDKYNLETIERE